MGLLYQPLTNIMGTFGSGAGGETHIFIKNNTRISLENFKLNREKIVIHGAKVA